MTHQTQTNTSTAVRQVDVDTAHQWLENGDATLIDVREPDEYAREHIAGARLMPLSRFDPAAVPVNNESSRILIHCRSGRRSLEAAAQLTGLAGIEVYSIKGGIQQWQRRGHPVVKARKAPISILRQVQITAGALVLLGTLLGVLISPWWLLLSGFVGAGLTFAGLSGTCGLALLLERLPWNRIIVEK